MRVLVVRVGRVGDMIMITPALQAILARHPGAEIHLLTSDEGARVLRGLDPRVTCVLRYEREGIASFLQRRHLRREIADGGYSHIYCFETNPSYRRLVDADGPAFHTVTPDNRHLHFAERCLRVVLDGPPLPSSGVWLPVTDDGRAAAHTLLAAAGIGQGSFVVGMHPSFSGVRAWDWRRSGRQRQKAWPLEYFGMLARRLRAHAAVRGMDLHVVVDLLPAERPFGEALVSAAGGEITLLTQRPDFERYKATIARMNLLIAPNTGPMHLAAALGTPVVALFAGFDPNDCGPYTDPARYAVLRAEDTEQPDKGLSAIPVERVFQMCLRFIP